jgi:hypothetical protein
VDGLPAVKSFSFQVTLAGDKSVSPNFNDIGEGFCDYETSTINARKGAGRGPAAAMTGGGKEKKLRSMRDCERGKQGGRIVKDAWVRRQENEGRQKLWRRLESVSQKRRARNTLKEGKKPGRRLRSVSQKRRTQKTVKTQKRRTQKNLKEARVC